MRQKHCALAALYVCALLGWNQLCATLSQTSDLVAKPPTAAQPDAFFAEGTTPHLCLNAEHLRHARPAGGREAAPVRWAAWAAAAAGRRRARARSALPGTPATATYIHTQLTQKKFAHSMTHLATFLTMHTPHKSSYFTLYTWHAPRGSACPRAKPGAP